jgi:hypothetical protein
LVGGVLLSKILLVRKNRQVGRVRGIEENNFMVAALKLARQRLRAVVS